MKSFGLIFLSFFVFNLSFASEDFSVPNTFHNSSPSDFNTHPTSQPDIKDKKTVISGVGSHKINIHLIDGNNKLVPVTASISIRNSNDSISVSEIQTISQTIKIFTNFKNIYSYTPKSVSVELDSNEGTLTLYYTAENSYGGTVSNSTRKYINKHNRSFYTIEK